MLALYIIIIIVGSYLLGGLNGAILISKSVFHSDVRELGSGNAGLTNFYRNFGTRSMVWVIVIDLGKAVAAVLLSGWLMAGLGYNMLGKQLAGLFVMCGHIFPVYFGFRGGKGVLTTLGAVASINWQAAAILFALFAVIVLITKYVSLGSIVAAVGYPVYFAAAYGDFWLTFIAALSAAIMVIKHSENIKRLIKGEESKLKLRK